MTTSVFDIYTIGIGPSSSHAVGPMRAARQFARSLQSHDRLTDTAEVAIELFGSLAFTGKGHGTDQAIFLGLMGETPEEVEIDAIAALCETVRNTHTLRLLGKKTIAFDEGEDLLFCVGTPLPGHSNGMRFTARDANGNQLVREVYYSIGGGFIIQEGDETPDASRDQRVAPRFPFTNAHELLQSCEEHALSIPELVLENEKCWNTEAGVRHRLLNIWEIMQECVERGLVTEGILPGGLDLRRRAPAIYRDLITHPEQTLRDQLSILDWVNLYALAVNEENAAGGRIVTAPTNGAAGIVPAVLHYYQRFSPHPTEEGIIRFLLTAGAIAILYKRNASISGAEVGCQGEVGVACSMAAGGLASAMGGTNHQIENAAEIGMEHNLGLTCDPVKGLVQIPCIERNAMAAVKAINAARIALRGDGSHEVSLDQVIDTMRQTGLDMKTKYKETSQGGLAVNVTEC
jgi:L-serine dehydratase